MEQREEIVQRLMDIAFAEDSEVRTGDRLRALEMVGKHFGMFKEAEPQEVAADEPLVLLLEELRKMRRSRVRAKAKSTAKRGDAV